MTALTVNRAFEADSMSPQKPQPQEISFSKPAWFTLVGGGVSIVASIWAFTLSVSNDIRELKTTVKAMDERHSEAVERIKRIETVYIK